MSNEYPLFEPTYVSEKNGVWYDYTPEFRQAEFDAPSGASAFFLHNNAEVGNPNHFALKLFFTKIEARAAYQRQKLAAEVGAAPPVGREVYVWEANKARFRYYGYETCVAKPLTQEEEDKLVPYYEDSPYRGPTSLRRILRRVGLAGTVISDVTRSNSWKYAPTNTRMTLGGDLHGENVMWWNGRLVCIDFGPHSVLTSGRGPIRQARA